MSGIQRVPIHSLVLEGRHAPRQTPQPYVWNLNLDQIESDTGKVLSKQMVSVEELGSSTHPFESGTVLYSKLRPYLNKVVVADADGVATTELVPLRCHPDKLLPQYLAYFLRSAEFLSFANTVVAGAKMPRMVMGEFWNYKIPLPPLPEQRRIAAILDKADALRAKRRKVLAQLDELETSCFERLSIQIKSAGLSPIPLGDVVERVTVGHVGPTSEYFCGQGIPFLRTGNVGKRYIDATDIKYIAPEFHKKIKKSALKTGDVLVSRVISDEVRCGVVPPELDGANCANVIVIRPSDSVSGTYLSFLIRCQESQKAFLQRQVGSAQSVVNTKVLQEWPIVVPSKALQDEFERQVSEIESLRKIQHKSMEDVSALVYSLQHRAFRGEL